MAGRCVIATVVSLVGIVLTGIFVGGVYYGGVVSRRSTCKHVAVACNFSEWSEWSHCSQQCGPYGTQFRVRNVLQLTGCGPVVCTEPTSEERPCNRVCYNGGSFSQDRCNCPVQYSGPCCECEDNDCQLSEWSEWSHCSQQCGPYGTQFRVRNVLQLTGCGPVMCTEPTSEERPCNRVCYNGGSLSQDRCNCPVHYSGPCCECEDNDCQLSEWSEWSHCSQQCGPYGTQFRVRNVLQLTGCGQVVCTQPTTEQKPCNHVCYNGGSLSQDGCNCPVQYSGPCCKCEDINCQLSQWSKWSSCEKATSRVRSRDVVRGSKCAGTECKGPYTEEQDCSVVLKGDVLVPKEIIITISIYAALVTAAIIILKLRTHRKKKKQDSMTPDDNYRRCPQDDNDNDSYQNSVASCVSG